MKEEALHKMICNYITLQYPDIIYNSDMAGVKLTMGQAKKASKLRSDKGFPDIFIYHTNHTFSGLFLEVKKETPFKKNLQLKSSDHLKQQQNIHKKLRRLKYTGGFVWNFEEAKQIIDNYMSIKKTR